MERRISRTLVRSSAIGGLDRTLGLVFGLARGAALLILAYIIAGLAEIGPDEIEPARQRVGVPGSVVSVGKDAGNAGGKFIGRKKSSLLAIDELLKPGFIDSVREKGEYLKGQLEGLVKKHPTVYVEQRGMGFLQGIQCTANVPIGDMVNKLQSLGLLVPPAGENVIRVFPALIADKAALDEGIEILSKAAESFEAAAQGANRAAE